MVCGGSTDDVIDDVTWPSEFKVVILISIRPVILYKIHLADICTLWAPSSLYCYRYSASSRGAEDCDECMCLSVRLFASISQETHVQTLPNFLCMLPVAQLSPLAVFPVLWMTDHFVHNWPGKRASSRFTMGSWIWHCGMYWNWFTRGTTRLGLESVAYDSLDKVLSHRIRCITAVTPGAVHFHSTMQCVWKIPDFPN